MNNTLLTLNYSEFGQQKQVQYRPQITIISSRVSAKVRLIVFYEKRTICDPTKLVLFGNNNLPEHSRESQEKHVANI